MPLIPPALKTRVVNSRGEVPVGAVYIGRPTKWGNPFRIGRDGTREEVIVKYRVWLLAQPDLIAACKRELHGRVLVCWCKPKACHGDVLAQIADNL